jgi:cyanophycinase-like exopeptidase
MRYALAALVMGCMLAVTRCDVPASGAVAGTASRCAVRAYKPAGLPRYRAVVSHGPGLVLDGGGDSGRGPFRWMEQTIARGGGEKADVVFLTSNDYSEKAEPGPILRRIGGFNAVRSFNIPKCATHASYAIVARAIDESEGVYIDGGAQENYVPWRNSAIAASIDRLYLRGGVVGGGSAGLAILGNFIYDAVAAGARNAVTGTPDAVEDPYEPRISLSGAIFHFGPLRNAITDTHLVVRDRLGRMIVFMARLVADGAVTAHPARILGVGVDEGSTIVVDRAGIGRLMATDGDGRAYLVVGGAPAVVRRGMPLQYDNLQMTILTHRNPTFDFMRWSGTTKPLALAIDGRRSYYRPFNPYR